MWTCFYQFTIIVIWTRFLTRACTEFLDWHQSTDFSLCRPTKPWQKFMPKKTWISGRTWVSTGNIIHWVRGVVSLVLMGGEEGTTKDYYDPLYFIYQWMSVNYTCLKVLFKFWKGSVLVFLKIKIDFKTSLPF